MSIAKIIRHFEAIGRVPVSVADVLKQVQAVVLDEVVEVRALDRSADKIRGFHYRYHNQPHADSALMPESIAVAAYSIQQPLGWQRLVCCKELIHIFDREPICTSSKEEVVRLGQKLTGESHFEKVDGENIQWFFDEIAKYQALAILFPFGLREELLAIKPPEKHDLAAISDVVQLPIEMVYTVMSDKWPLLREGILANG